MSRLKNSKKTKYDKPLMVCRKQGVVFYDALITVLQSVSYEHHNVTLITQFLLLALGDKIYSIAIKTQKSI